MSGAGVQGILNQEKDNPPRKVAGGNTVRASHPQPPSFFILHYSLFIRYSLSFTPPFIERPSTCVHIGSKTGLLCNPFATPL
jgi:hypothetical protein